MKIAVIDDEKPQADILYSICNAYFGGHKQNVQIDCFPDGIAFFNSFKENTYKIAFVDIFMEKMNGIAVAEKLREKDRDIIIVCICHNKPRFYDAGIFRSRFSLHNKTLQS